MSLFMVFWMAGSAQPNNWQNLDIIHDSIFGISLNRAYKDVLKNNKLKIVTVAVIDSGTDTLHEDLRSVLWVDKNGHRGWNYIGSEMGQEDVTLLTGNKKDVFDSLSFTSVPEAYRSDYQRYRKMRPILDGKLGEMRGFIRRLENADNVTATIIRNIGKPSPTLDDFKRYQSKNEEEKSMVNLITEKWPIYGGWEMMRISEIDKLIELANYHVAHGLNVLNFEPDTAVGNVDITPDPTGLLSDPNLTAYHGTHVAGIIGAVRLNNIGIDGVAGNVRIMTLKMIGTIRELREISLAKAIRFAVDNGASIINLSFGKPYTLNKAAVDNAVRYAMARDVLIVHGAGNNGENLDEVKFYPNKFFDDDKRVAGAWIEVGASGPKDDQTLPSTFSNFGKTTVDVFAPGEKIYSTIPGSAYDTWSGTSMAAPIVSGLAALIWGSYPKLTAVQVKEIIMKSVVKRDVLKDKCVSGGIVNAYNALKLAATYK